MYTFKPVFRMMCTVCFRHYDMDKTKCDVDEKALKKRAIWYVCDKCHMRFDPESAFCPGCDPDYKPKTFRTETFDTLQLSIFKGGPLDGKRFPMDCDTHDVPVIDLACLLDQDQSASDLRGRYVSDGFCEVHNDTCFRVYQYSES
jgi:hypothetical protein